MQEIRLKRLNINDPDQVSFMYKVRTDPTVSQNLISNGTINYVDHVNYLNKNQNKKAFFVIYNDETPIGYTHFTIDDLSLSEVGWALHSDFHGKGLGYKSIKKTLDLMSVFFPSYCVFKLVVFEKNKVAFNIYTKMGFKLKSRKYLNSQYTCGMEKKND